MNEAMGELNRAVAELGRVVWAAVEPPLRRLAEWLGRRTDRRPW